MILFDTHALYWYFFHPGMISAKARVAIEQADRENQEAAVSVFSLYELIYSINRGRIRCATPVSTLLGIIYREFTLLPVTREIAISAAELDAPFHGDPIDRVIVATAMLHDCTLITADTKIRNVGICKTAW